MINFIISICLFLAAIFLALVLYGKTVRKEKSKKTQLLSVTELLCALLLIFYLVNFLGIDAPFTKAVVVLGNSIVMVLLDCMLLLSIEYILNFEEVPSNKNIKTVKSILWSLGVIDSLFVLANGIPYISGFAMHYERVLFLHGTHPIYGLLADGGFWYYPHFCYVYLIAIISAFAYIKKMISIPRIYAGRYIMLTLSYLLLIAWNVYLRLTKLHFYVDLSLPIISLIVAAAYKITYEDKPSFMLYKTRKLVFDFIEDPILLFDMNDKLVDYNLSARKIFLADESNRHEISLPAFLATKLDMQITPRSTSTVEEITVFVPPADRRVFKLDYDILSDKRERRIGTLLVFNDITELNKMYKSVELVSMNDETTGLSSHIMLLRKITELNLYKKFPYAAAVCEVNGLRVLHDGIGQEAADNAAKFTADTLKTYLQHDDFAAYHDGTIYLLLPCGEREKIERTLISFSDKLVDDNTLEYPISIEYGISVRTSPEENIQDTISAAENEMYSKKVNNSDTVHSKLLESLKNTLAQSESETEQHSSRVSKVAVCLGRRLGLTDKDLTELSLLAQFHDIGKLSIPDKLLLKAGQLTAEEKSLMSIHTIRGCQIAKNSPELQPIANYILCHHEWWNGTGYPNGYKGEDIPYLSRIISIVDAFDVMTHSRAYHKAIPEEDALKEIEKCAGTQFDPVIAAAFIAMIKGQQEEESEQNK